MSDNKYRQDLENSLLMGHEQVALAFEDVNWINKKRKKKR